MHLKHTSALIPALLLLGLAGCSALPSVDDVLPDRKVEYKKSKQAGKNLEIPPDLTRSTINDELVIPGESASGSATLSGMMEQERIQGRVATRASVLPKIDKIEVKRDGDQRWLEVEGNPDDVWYKVIEFWQENGILLEQQDPTVGVMVTTWLENRADIKTDFITDTIRGAFDGLYSASTRDQYRVRIEPGMRRGITEVYLTHRGMQEKILQNPGGEQERNVWNPRPTDHGLEAEMLRRMMVFMGIADQQATSLLARKGGAEAPRSRLLKTRDEISLMIGEDPRRAWRLTGVALDRVGFAVEDRDRENGVYYVRYNDPMKDVDEPGLLDKLMFWRDNDRNINKESQYQIRLRSSGDGTLVTVLDEGGNRDNSETAQRILTLLNEQIQ